MNAEEKDARRQGSSVVENVVSELCTSEKHRLLSLTLFSGQN